MAKRNIAEEIQQLQERDQFRENFTIERLLVLSRASHALKGLKEHERDEFYRYFPIASVACLESFMRQAVAELVDYGSQYFENLSLLLDKLSLKIDFEILKSLHKKEFTIGELVAHLIKCNSIADINSTLTTIMGADFFSEIKEHIPVFLGPNAVLPFGDKIEEIKKSIVRSFTLRHIYCHETGQNTKVDAEESLTDLINCAQFIDRSSDYIYSRIKKNWGLHPPDLLERVKEEYEQQKEAFEKTIVQLKTKSLNYLDYPEETIALFDKTFESWQQYSESSARLQASYITGGTWAAKAYYENKMITMDQFISSLSKEEEKP